jgi:anti-anti-sigma factor
MDPIQGSSVTVAPRGLQSTAERDAERTVVFLQGEHDASTVVELSLTMASAIALDEADLVVDLRDVSFMGAATVRLLVRAASFLRLRTRSLVVRSPPRQAQRILDLCGVGDLVDSRPASAIQSWGVGTSSRPGDRRAHRDAEPVSRRLTPSGTASCSRAWHPAGRAARKAAPQGAP